MSVTIANYRLGQCRSVKITEIINILENKNMRMKIENTIFEFNNNK